MPGFVSLLLQVVVSNDVQFTVRQSGKKCTNRFFLINCREQYMYSRFDWQMNEISASQKLNITYLITGVFNPFSTLRGSPLTSKIVWR